MGIVKKLSEKVSVIVKETKDYLKGDTDEVLAEQVVGEEMIEEQFPETEVIAEQKSEGYAFTKEQARDLDILLGQANFVDGRHLWIAGFENFIINKDAKATKLFAGKKDLKFLAIKDHNFYLLKFEKNILMPYKTFHVEDVLLIDSTTKLTKSSIRLVFKDDTKFSIDITENKGTLKMIKAMF